MLVLKIVEDLESEVVVVRGVSGWRGVGGNERGEGGGRRRYGRCHGERMLPRIVSRVFVEQKGSLRSQLSAWRRLDYLVESRGVVADIASLKC